MKKNLLKGLTFAVVAAFMVACSGGIDGEIKKFENAAKAGDRAKAYEVIEALEQEYDIDQFSREQKDRIDAAYDMLYGY